MKQAGIRDMIKKASKGVLHQLLWCLPLPPTPTISSAVKTQQSQMRNPMTQNQQTNRVSNKNASLISCTSQV
jgi:hypothetical protein